MSATRSELLVFGYIFNEEKNFKCIIPHEIYHIILLFYPHLYELSIKIHQLDKLISTDMLSRSSDPYVLVTFNGIQNKTSTYAKKTTVHVNQVITIPIEEPIHVLTNNQIIIQVMDYDPLGDEIIGTLKFNFNNIKDFGYFETNRWVHIYGAPHHHKCQNHIIAEKMNKSIICGTTFRGSMLLSIQYKQTQNQTPQRYKINWNKNQCPKIATYVLEVDVYKVIGINQKYNTDCTGKKLALQMMMRNRSYKTESARCINGICEWYEIMRNSDYFDEQATIELRMPIDVTQCPDIIFYLIEKPPYTPIFSAQQPLLYKRVSWSNILKLAFNTPPKWYSLQSSQVLTETHEQDECVPYVLLGIRAGLKTNKPKSGVIAVTRPYPTEQKECKNEIVLNRNRTSRITEAQTKGRLHVTVVNAKNAPLSNLYVSIAVNGQWNKTSVQKSTLHPVWNETFMHQEVSIYDELEIQLNQWHRFAKKVQIGKVENIILIDLLKEANGILGVDFNHTKKYFISKKYEHCSVIISVSFDFDARICGGGRRIRRAPVNILKRQMLHASLLGKPISKLYKITLEIDYIELLNHFDDDNQYLFQISHCGKSNRVKFNLYDKVKQFNLDVEVPEPIKYAPNIRFSVYKSHIVDQFDLIGMYFVSVCDVIKLMNSCKMRIWKNLILMKEGETPINNGRVYFSVAILSETQMTIELTTQQEIEMSKIIFIEKEIEQLSMKQIIKFTKKRCERVNE